MPLISALPECSLPAVPSALGATCLSLLYQFEQSQWWTAEQLMRRQLRQATDLLRHARDTVPWYQLQFVEQAFDEDLSIGTWRELPILKRSQLQETAGDFHSTAPPADHGRAFPFQTSGSTGSPIKGISNDAANLFSHAAMLRDHTWHRRDLSGKLAVLRFQGSRRQLPNWGAPASTVFETGPMVTLDIQTPVHEQADWLCEQNPNYLMSHPSNLRALARHCLEHGLRIPALRQVRSFGEVVAEELPDLCRQAWQADLVDAYSARETGTLALQCPDTGHYHVQSELSIVEVLDAQDRPCQPGETGRIIITPLHNYFMPLIRYDIGDYAEVGTPCACGRGLPVLTHIAGRTRNLVVMPDGSRHIPSMRAARYGDIADIRQMQIVQDSTTHMVVHIVLNEALSNEQENRLRTALVDGLRFPHELELRRVDTIPRGAGEKFEDFISHVDE